jgi:hypothetical protein
VIPSLVVAVGEISVLSVWHPTLAAAVVVLAVGHAVLLISMLFRIWAWAPNAQVREATTSASTRS